MRFKIGAIIALLVGPFILFMNHKETSEKTKIDKEGTETTALVVDKIETRGRKGRRNLDLKITFVAGEAKTPVTKTLDASKELWEKTSEASPLKVKYLKEDPNQVIIVGEPMGEPFLYAVGGAVLLYGLGGSWYNFIRKPKAA